MNHIRKGRVFEDKKQRKKIYKVISLVESANPYKPATIVVFRECFMDVGGVDIDFLYYSTAQWQYLELKDFDDRFELFTPDEVTLFRIREGLYE